MAIPLATTTISITGVRPESPADPLSQGYPDTPDAPAAAVVASGVRACISQPGMAREVRQSGNDGMQTEVWALRCDPADLRIYDTVTDETTGVEYAVQSVVHSRPLLHSLDHTFAVLRVRKGLPT